MGIVLVLGYILPVISLLAVAVLIVGIVGLSGYSLFESMSERRVSAAEIVQASS